MCHILGLLSRGRSALGILSPHALLARPPRRTLIPGRECSHYIPLNELIEIIGPNFDIDLEIERTYFKSDLRYSDLAEEKNVHQPWTLALR